MSSPLTFKRRKLNENTSTLTRPFVSPLKTPKPGQPPLQPNENAANISYQPSVLAHTISAISPVFSKLVPQTKASGITPARSTPTRKHITFSSNGRRTDPAELAAQKALTALELQIRTLRREIDTLTQAVRLTASTTDADLEDLALKWKLASQAAAEELFGTVKERVCRMGGVVAWRESEKRKFERSNGLGEWKEEKVESDDDAGCEFDSQGEELPEEEQEFRKAEKRRMKREMKDVADVEEGVNGEKEEKSQTVWQEEGGDDDAFTMDMMLRSLNVELDVIGYDKVTQRWIT